jgi:hypothetical protein
MADIIHSYCSTCLIIDEAPFKICCDGHIAAATYLKLSKDAGNPSCKACILQDKEIIKIDTKVGNIIKSNGGDWKKSDSIKINNRTLGHLLEDHHRESIVLNIVPQLPTLLSKYEFAIVSRDGTSAQYYITVDDKTYRVPVNQKGNRWLIPSIFEVDDRVKQQYKNKPNGILVENI